MESSKQKTNLTSVIAPGLLVAATGVGAGDLATAGFAGGQLGVAVLWAVAVGAFFKFVLNEGLARWQLATGTTLLEGAVNKFGTIAAWIFLPYFFLWSFFVCSALMGACGVAAHAILPIFEDVGRAKIVFGIVHSLLGSILVLAGGFRLFEKVMGVCIALMFVTVTATACLLAPNLSEIVRGLLIPSAETLRDPGLSWTAALMGGVGGTLTVLCYGYWIREKGRTRPEDMNLCRIDLAVGYFATALFGMAMVVIGSQIVVEGKGALLVVRVAESLQERVGVSGKWLFLVGAWSAVFSSLLGVWQSVPYIFADFLQHVGRRSAAIHPSEKIIPLSETTPYRVYLFIIALAPMAGLIYSFKEIQKIYAIVGACFMPLLALALLILNGRKAWVGIMRNRPSAAAVLSIILCFFAWLFLKAMETS